MKLEATDEELQSLLELKYLKPNGLGNKTSYLIEIVNIYNEKQEVVLNVEKSAESAVPSNQVSLFEKIEDWIDEWRTAWAGKRLKAIGVKDTVVKNMTEFMKVYPQYTKLIIFKARDRYMTSFKGDYSYLEQADYFIKKRVIVDGETTIRRTLLQYCEEVMLVEQVTTSNINLNDNNNYDVL